MFHNDHSTSHLLFSRLCLYLQTSFVAQLVKNPAANAGDRGSIPGSERFPGGGYGNPFQYSWLENPRGQRSLVGYSPWGCRESDTTELLESTALSVCGGFGGSVPSLTLSVVRF